MLQVHYNISFEVKSQRFNNDILAEQGCASIKKQTFLNFHSRNVIFSIFWDFVMSETRDLGHNGEK
jgi:hypothetical protein